MITRDIDRFLRIARTLPVDRAACAKALFLVAPEGFALADESARDNRYMDLARAVDGERALAQHRDLHRALSAVLPTICFAGDPATPDAVFPNNAFATAPGRILLGHMRHPVRQRETERADIRGFFSDALGYELHDLRKQPGFCELTGSLVIDRARGLGFCGLSERCDETGAAAMHSAFDLRATLLFELAPGEYHSNVVMSALAGRGLAVCPDGFADPAVPAALASLYAPAVIELDRSEKTAFAGNCIAVTDGSVWMSGAAADALGSHSRRGFEQAGFALKVVALDEIEKAGGSLRCCVGEIF
jgi:hypothetical protein